MAEERGLHLSVDVEGVLHLSRNDLVDAPFELSTSPDYATSYPYTAFRHALDSVELTNAVRVHGARHRRWVLDEDSIATYGRQESSIVDDSLRTLEQVRRAGRRRLEQLAEPIVEGALVCWEPGLRAGMRVRITNDPWGIDGDFVLTEVHISAVDPHDADGEARLRSRGDVHRRATGGTAPRVRQGPAGPGQPRRPRDLLRPGAGRRRAAHRVRRYRPGSTSTRSAAPSSSEQDFGRADNDRAEDRFWDDMQEEG